MSALCYSCGQATRHVEPLRCGTCGSYAVRPCLRTYTGERVSGTLLEFDCPDHNEHGVALFWDSVLGLTFVRVGLDTVFDGIEEHWHLVMHGHRYGDDAREAFQRATGKGANE